MEMSTNQIILDAKEKQWKVDVQYKSQFKKEKKKHGANVESEKQERHDNKMGKTYRQSGVALETDASSQYNNQQHKLTMQTLRPKWYHQRKSSAIYYIVQPFCFGKLFFHLVLDFKNTRYFVSCMAKVSNGEKLRNAYVFYYIVKSMGLITLNQYILLF
jgi:hypothetical protein